MKEIFVQPKDGLANRMRTIVGAISLAKKIKCKVTVLWVRDPMLNAKFNDIFAPIPGIKVYEYERNSKFLLLHLIYIRKIIKSYYVDDNWIVNNVRPYKDDTFISQLAGHNVLIHSCYDIIRAGDYSIFKLSKKMTDRIMPEVITDKNIIGIHIRRTDNLKSIKYSPTNLFIDKMKEELSNNSDTKFYLATDDPNEEKELKDRFKTHILTYTKTSLNRNNPNAIYDAVIDLYHLSQCKKLYASYWSSFSDIAALWGNINKYVLAKDIE
ncbi:MAG: hypothetical protein IJ640_06310 [Prevotella sp.]|nr:hypothetical protein [Prevotella sp.]